MEDGNPPKFIVPVQETRIIGEAYLNRLQDWASLRIITLELAKDLQSKYPKNKYGSTLHTEDLSKKEEDPLDFVAHTLIDTDRNVQVFSFIAVDQEWIPDENLVLKVLSRCARDTSLGKPKKHRYLISTNYCSEML